MDFNKVQASGFQADVRAYAYLKTTKEVTNQVTGSTQLQTFYYLYYLDIISRDAQSLNAILPGLVKEPSPNPVRLFWEDNKVNEVNEEEEEVRDNKDENSLLMWAAQKAQVSTRKLFSIALKQSCAYEGVLVPTAALSGLSENERTRKPGNAKSGSEYFLLLLLDDMPQMRQFKLSELYHERLNKLVSIPLLPQWHEWSWQFGTENGLVQPLVTKGCEAYLCQVPDEIQLALALREAIQAGLLYTGPDLAPGEVFTLDEPQKGQITQLPVSNSEGEKERETELPVLDKAS